MPSKIEWTGETWNPIRARLLSDPARVGWHCTHASDGCRFCYAERMNRRGIGTGLDYKPGNEKLIDIYLDEKVLDYPRKWAKPRLIFPGSMTDLFADFVTDAMLDRIFAVAAETERHTYQFLTKRPDRAAEYLGRLWACGQHGLAHVSDSAEPWPFPNCWVGTSVEDARVKHRIDELRQVPAAVHFLSIEPLIGSLGELDLTGIDWVIVGGESGPSARPMDGDWAREVRDQCDAQGVPMFFKQHGEWIDVRDLRRIPGGAGPGFGTYDHCQYDQATETVRVGKKNAGRLLDGVIHDAMPGRK